MRGEGKVEGEKEERRKGGEKTRGNEWVRWGKDRKGE